MEVFQFEVHEERSELEGVLLQADVPTRNGRIYPAAVLKRAAEVAKDAPSSLAGYLVEPGREFEVKVADAVCYLTSIKFDGTYLTFKAKFFDSGPAMKKVRSSPGSYDVFPSGRARISELSVVQDDYVLRNIIFSKKVVVAVDSPSVE